MAGMGATLFSLRSSKPARSWFFASTLFWLAASAIQQYDWVANTRMYILVPLYTLYAGIGGHALAQLLVPYSSRIRMFLIILLAAAAMILNQWHINQVSLVYSRDAWSVFGFALQQFQVTANLDETTPSGGLPIFVVQDDTTYSPLTWIIPAYEAKPERMTLFTPDEVLQDVPSCTKIESAANHPAMFLIPANDAQREALRAYVITCWPGAVETVLSNRTGHPLWVRFLTPSTPAFETYPGPPPTANSEAAQPKPESPLASPLAIPSPSPPVVPQATPSSIASPLETP
jgi:hypothetical protein